MANLIDITTNVLSQNTICFETRNINVEQIPVPIQDAKFGILNFVAVTAEETKDEIDFVFIVDCSGSMSDKCSDGRSKIQHIIHTLKNIHILPCFYLFSNFNIFYFYLFYLFARFLIFYLFVFIFLSFLLVFIHTRNNEQIG